MTRAIGYAYDETHVFTEAQVGELRKLARSLQRLRSRGPDDPEAGPAPGAEVLDASSGGDVPTP